MGSFRVGQIAGALSHNLGLFAEREVEKERDRISREWEMTMADLREGRAQAREERMNARADEREQARMDAQAERDRLTTERYMADKEATAAYRRDTLEQGQSQFDIKRGDQLVSDIARGQQSIMEEWRKAREEAAESLEEGAKEAVDAWYQKQFEDFTVGQVAYGNQQGIQGFEATDKNQLESLFTRNGLGVDRAKNLAGQIWPQIDPASADLFGAEGDPNPAPGEHPRENPEGWFYEDMYGDMKMPPGVQREGGIVGEGSVFEQELARRGGTQAAGPEAPPAPPAPAVTPPSVKPPTPGSLQDLFQSEPETNPDGSPKYPMNRNSLGYKAFEWLKSPTPYGQ